MRIILAAIWLIFSTLLIYEFEPGGRYLILLEAFVIGSLTHYIRAFTSKWVNFRLSSLLSAGGVVLGLLLFRFIHTGMRLSFLGILIAYLGIALMEMLIPESYWRQMN